MDFRPSLWWFYCENTEQASYVARAWRTRVRWQVWPAWQEDWTTDPTCRIDGVRLYRFDREGFPIPPGSFRSRFIDLVLQTLCLVLGRRVCREPDLHYPSWQGEDLGLLTQGGEPRKLVVPGLAVMPPSWTLAEARERTVQERIIRVDGDDPAPGTGRGSGLTLYRSQGL